MYPKDMLQYVSFGVDAALCIHDKLDTMPKNAPQHVRFADFCAGAVITPLVGHPRAGRIAYAGRDLGFIDATGEHGLRQAHEREVNNALYAHDGEAPDFMRGVPIPTADVLAEYPDLRSRFPNAARLVYEASRAKIVARHQQTKD